jgi:hypothetical protein
MVGEVLLNKVSPVALGQFTGEAVEVKAVYRSIIIQRKTTAVSRSTRVTYASET